MNENSAEDDLSRTISDMQAQSRALGDALRQFTDDGLSALTQAAQGRNMGGSTQSTSEFAASELSRLLRTELSEALQGVFSPAGSDSSTTGSVINVVIHNNTSAQVSAQETTGGGDQKTLEITIDQMVAQSLAHGRQTSSVLQSLFGLAPSLIGR